MRLFAAVLLGAACVAVQAQQSGGSHDSHHAAAVQLSDGEVRRVDKDAKKITIRHGAIANLDMPPHTMVFQVKDPAMLDKVKAGDKVKFQAEKTGGAFTLTHIEPAQ